MTLGNYSWIDVSSKSQNWWWWVQGGAINTSFSEAFRDSQNREIPGQTVGTPNFPTDLETVAAAKHCSALSCSTLLHWWWVHRPQGSPFQGHLFYTRISSLAPPDGCKLTSCGVPLKVSWRMHISHGAATYRNWTNNRSMQLQQRLSKGFTLPRVVKATS